MKIAHLFYHITTFRRRYSPSAGWLVMAVANDSRYPTESADAEGAFCLPLRDFWELFGDAFCHGHSHSPMDQLSVVDFGFFFRKKKNHIEVMHHDVSWCAQHRFEYSREHESWDASSDMLHLARHEPLESNNLSPLGKMTYVSGPFWRPLDQTVRRSLATSFSARKCPFPKIFQGDNSFLIQKNLWRGRGRCLSRSPLINKIQAGFKLTQHSTCECQEALDATSEFCDMRTFSSLKENLRCLFDPLSRISIWI